MYSQTVSIHSSTTMHSSNTLSPIIYQCAAPIYGWCNENEQLSNTPQKLIVSSSHRHQYRIDHLLTLKANEMIIENWCRKLQILSTSISINDIISIINLFHQSYFERFDQVLSHQTNQYWNNHCNVYSPNEIGWKFVFGSVTAIPLRKYYWKLKLIRGCAHFGIIEANWCKSVVIENIMWWTKSIGYSYFDHGVLYHNGQFQFDEKIRKGDTIEIWLDLESTLTLTYVVNTDSSCNCFKLNRCFVIKGDTVYKLALALNNAEVSLLSFKESY